MARIRSIKPELRTSLVVASWPREVRYCWVLLWGYLDDEGRGVDDARLVKADCFPLDDDVTARKLNNWLDRFVQSGPLCRYEVAGQRYMHAVNWKEHQRPSHPSRSRFPPCPLHTGSGEIPEGRPKGSGGVPDGLVPEQGAGSREGEQGAGSRAESADDVPPRADVERICRHLADRIEGNGSKRPDITKKWRDAARLLLDKDGRSVEQVIACIDWCQSSTFWRPNILSMPKLREKYDQLRLQAAADRERAGNAVARRGPVRSATSERVGMVDEAYEQLMAEMGTP